MLSLVEIDIWSAENTSKNFFSPLLGCICRYLEYTIGTAKISVLLDLCMGGHWSSVSLFIDIGAVHFTFFVEVVQPHFTIFPTTFIGPAYCS